jgi:hypothetical protein
MLQDTNSFTKHACAECAVEFAPDSTIYPHPVKADSGNTYLCYTCFLLNGGSKGECGSCGRHVLILKSEGKFVKYAERFWHASCFRCRGCLKDLSSNPAVDLLGMPCCSTCFDTTETKPSFNPKPISGSKDPSESEVLIEELAHKLQSCSPASSPKRSTPRRLSSAQNSPSTTPIRSARRLSSRGEHKQSPRAVSGNSQLPKGENAGSGVKRFAKPTMRALDRDVFGPVQVNGVSLESKMCMDKASTSGTPVLKRGALTIETNPENPAQTSASRFGTSTVCPGCHRAVSPMEIGVVPGPQGTRWHSNCLVCGGKRSQPSGKHDGCGKKLDSSAKTDKAGRLFCRNCLVSWAESLLIWVRNLRTPPEWTSKGYATFSSNIAYPNGLLRLYHCFIHIRFPGFGNFDTCETDDWKWCWRWSWLQSDSFFGSKSFSSTRRPFVTSW